MKLYQFPFAPNPMKVLTYLGEKGIDLPYEQINLVQGEQKQPAFLAINPRGALPALELDDGTCITESLAILEYFEELHPDPPMIGSDPVARARVRAHERLIDQKVLGNVAMIIHNTNSPLPSFEKIPAVAEKAREHLDQALVWVNDALAEHAFAAAEHVTIADCTLFGALRFARFSNVEIGPEFARVHAWFEKFEQRPSADFAAWLERGARLSA